MQKECGHYNCQDADCGCIPASCGVPGHWSGDGLDHTKENRSYHNGHEYKCQCDGWIVPEGGTYYVSVSSDTYKNYSGARTTYIAGQQIPCNYTPSTRDVYVDEDYEYRYKRYFSGGWCDGSNAYDWGVRVLDTSKSVYGEILPEIANKPVTNMDWTFNGCRNMKEVPVIPQGVIRFANSFNSCALIESITLPESVTILSSLTFSGCTSLNNIYFEGTIAQWGAIWKDGTNWRIGVPATVAHCSDGDVTL